MQSEAVRFGRCVLAIGSKPKAPPVGFIDPVAQMDRALLGWKDEAVRAELRECVASGKVNRKLFVIMSHG